MDTVGQVLEKSAAQSDFDANMQGWRERWQFIPAPAPGILGMVPINSTPKREGNQRGKDARPSMVLWLVAMEDGLIRKIAVPGTCSKSWEAALATLKFEEVVPVLHRDDSPVLLSASMGCLPPPGMDGKSDRALLLNAAIRKEGKLLMDAFQTLLRPEALQAARATLRSSRSTFTVNAYNTFVGAGTRTENHSIEKMGEWRRQIAVRWPLLSGILATNTQLVDACDRGESVPVMAAKAIGVSMATLRALAGTAFGKQDEYHVAPKTFWRAIRLADVLPVSMLPSDDREWNTCLQVVNKLWILLKHSNTMDFLDERLDGLHVNHSWYKRPVIYPYAVTWLENFVGRNGSRWGADRICRERETALENPLQQVRARMGSQHALDACTAFTREILLPMGINNPDNMRWLTSANMLIAQGALALLSRRSLHSFHMVCWRHLEWTRLPNMLVEPPLEDFVAPVSEEPQVIRRNGWSALAPDIQTPNGWTIRNLMTQAALDKEGVEMEHCVRTYGWMCMEGSSSILSLTSSSGERSTAEIGLRHVVKSRAGKTPPAHSRLTVFQHKGIGNKVVPSGGTEALLWYLWQIASGDIEHDAERLTLMGRNTNNFAYGHHVDVARLADMQALAEPEARRLAWERWRRWLNAREATPEEWVAALPRELGMMSDFSPYQTCTGHC